MIPCLCIDDKNRPFEIPHHLWVKEGCQYHITWIKYHAGQGIQGVELKEIRLNEECMPFNSFALRRFAIRKEDMDAFMELLAVCSKKSINLEEIINQEIVEP